MTKNTNGTIYWQMVFIHSGVALYVQSIHMPGDEKMMHFVSRQETCRKDVERCFVVLQAHFAIIRNPCRQWNMETIADFMFTCCILHNMILDDEHDVPGLENILAGEFGGNVPLRRCLFFQELATHTVEIENKDTHYGLRGDLIEYLWALKGTRA
jgi:hypothetical protein